MNDEIRKYQERAKNLINENEEIIKSNKKNILGFINDCKMTRNKLSFDKVKNNQVLYKNNLNKILENNQNNLNDLKENKIEFLKSKKNFLQEIRSTEDNNLYNHFKNIILEDLYKENHKETNENMIEIEGKELNNKNNNIYNKIEKVEKLKNVIILENKKQSDFVENELAKEYYNDLKNQPIKYDIINKYNLGLNEIETKNLNEENLNNKIITTNKIKISPNTQYFDSKPNNINNNKIQIKTEYNKKNVSNIDNNNEFKQLDLNKSSSVEEKDPWEDDDEFD